MMIKQKLCVREPFLSAFSAAAVVVEGGASHEVLEARDGWNGDGV